MDVSDERWAHHEERVLQFLGLRRLPDPVIPVEHLQAFVGRYENPEHKEYLCVERQGTDLCLVVQGGSTIVDTNYRSRLLPLDDSLFVTGEVPLEIRFLPAGGIEMGETPISFVRWSSPGTLFAKVNEPD